MGENRITDLRRLLTTPGWRRSLLLRRAAALVLMLLAGFSALRSAGATDPQVVVFTRAVAAGEAVSAGDVALRPVPAGLSPGSAYPDPALAEGRVVVSAVEPGEIATPARFVGAEVAAALVGGEGEAPNMVPLKLAEPEIIPLLHHGDTVSVVTHTGEVIAEEGRIVLADVDGTVLLALPRSSARVVAAASLNTPLAVVLTGQRATGAAG